MADDETVSQLLRVVGRQRFGCSMTIARRRFTSRSDLPHQIATRAIGGVVSIAIVRDPADGSIRHCVAYQSAAAQWLSRHRFQDVGQAEAGAITLSDFLGAEYLA
jgi:hypothetical protein